MVFLRNPHRRLHELFAIFVPSLFRWMFVDSVCDRVRRFIRAVEVIDHINYAPIPLVEWGVHKVIILHWSPHSCDGEHTPKSILPPQPQASRYGSH